MSASLPARPGATRAGEPDRPHYTLAQQIDHVDASIIALEHAIENGDARTRSGKLADPLRDSKLNRLRAWRDVLATLAFVRDHAEVIRAAVGRTIA